MQQNCQVVKVSYDSIQSMEHFDKLPAKAQHDLLHNKFKTVDCKLLHNIFEEFQRQSMISKVKDQGYVFVPKLI